MIKVTIEIANQPVYITVDSIKIENNQIFITGIMPGVQKEEWPDLGQQLSQQAETMSPFQDYILKACTDIFKKNKIVPASTETIKTEITNVEAANDDNTKVVTVKYETDTTATQKSKKLRISKKGKPANTGTKKCVECGKDYKPTSNGQKKCVECKQKEEKPTKTNGLKVCSICKKEFKFTSNGEKRCPDCKGKKVEVAKAPVPETKSTDYSLKHIPDTFITKDRTTKEDIIIQKELLDPMGLKGDKAGSHLKSNF